MSTDVYALSCEILKNKPIHRHSFFQLKHFVIGKELTVQAQLRKCLVELEARKEAIEGLFLSIEDIQDDCEIIDIELEKLALKIPEDDLANRHFKVEIRKLKRKRHSLVLNLENLKLKLKENEEEAAFFAEAYKQLEKVETLKEFDDFEENSKLWNEIYSQELKLRILLQKPLDLELVKGILALNKEAPIKQEMINILGQAEANALKITQKQRIESDREKK